MRKITVFLLLAIMVIAITASSVEARSGCVPGIQRNLPVHVNNGKLTQDKATEIQAVFDNQGEIKEVLIPGGVGGYNCYQDTRGNYHADWYVVAAGGRMSRYICDRFFLKNCDNLFLTDWQPPCDDQPIIKRPPPPLPQRVEGSVDLKPGPVSGSVELKTQPLEGSVTLKQDKPLEGVLKLEGPISGKLEVTGTLKLEGQQQASPSQPISITINNIQPAGAKPYYGPGGMQSCHTTTTYQVGGFQQVQLYPQGGNVTATATSSSNPVVTATGGAGGAATATGGSATAIGGNAAASAAAAANAAPPKP